MGAAIFANCSDRILMMVMVVYTSQDVTDVLVHLSEPFTAEQDPLGATTTALRHPMLRCLPQRHVKWSFRSLTLLLTLTQLLMESINALRNCSYRWR